MRNISFFVYVYFLYKNKLRCSLKLEGPLNSLFPEILLHQCSLDPQKYSLMFSKIPNKIQFFRDGQLFS